MRYYETLFIVHPNYEQDRLQTIVGSVENEIKKFEGKIINNIDWGKRRLAYPIEKQKYGNFILIQFSADPSVIDKLYKWLELQVAVLAQIVVRLDEEPKLIEKEKTFVSQKSEERVAPKPANKVAE